MKELKERKLLHRPHSVCSSSPCRLVNCSLLPSFFTVRTVKSISQRNAQSHVTQLFPPEASERGIGLDQIPVKAAEQNSPIETLMT